MHSKDQSHRGSSLKKTLILGLAAIGVVYGDIGTSPLYAINEIFFGHAHLAISPENILGSISLVIWALTLIIAVKYVIFVLRADNQGQGGIFALYSLLFKENTKKVAVIIPLLIFAAGLLLGDGMITPAISVVSAMEGLKVVTVKLEPYIIPLTLVILTSLFLIQKKGTAKIGKVFGPIICLWFIVIGVLGFMQVINNIEIIKAFNPIYAFRFLASNNFHKILLVLGSVMLVITGGEAMYADMGHFGKKSIRLTWFSLTYPALLLSYLGQGAYLLGGGKVLENNIFYSLSPSWFLVPLVFLATIATIIASQALISGAFSLVTQGISLGLFPLLQVRHTHHEHEGQIYVPFINWMLYFGTVVIVLIFRSSTRLASAYGLAVSGVMIMTTIAIFGVARYKWRWSKKVIFLIFTPFALIDFLFLSANSLKFFDGGFIPFSIGLAILTFMMIWRWGRKEIKEEIDKNYSGMTISDLINIKKTEKSYIPRSIIVMLPEPLTSITDSVPASKQILWERYGLLPKDLIFLTVQTNRVPHIKDIHDRFVVHKFFEDKEKGSITSIQVKFGFMEDPDVEKALINLAKHKHKDINIDEHPNHWLIHVTRARLFHARSVKGLRYIMYSVFRIILRISIRADRHFGLGKNVSLTMESIPITID